MKKKSTILADTIAAIFILFLCAHVQLVVASDYNVGSYNIRIATPDDTGLKNWANRKEFVAKTIVDNQFDIISIQEISDTSQKNDLMKLLPGYTMLSWGRESAEVDQGEAVGIVFRQDKFTVLDHGYYFLTPDPKVPGLAWDAAHQEVSVWAKFQDKSTAEVFFFCATHFDNVGVIAKKEEARVNVEMMNKIALGFPVFIVGDLNAKIHEDGVHFTLGAYYNDSRSTPGIPILGPDGTYSGWNPARSDTKRIDYVYSHLVDILFYKAITDDYGRGVTPSDHFCLMVTARLQQPLLPRNIYVSTEGNDAANGSITQPFKSINKALRLAQTYDTLRVTEGRFIAAADPATINRDSCLRVGCSVTVIGGYDNTFDYINGYTTLDADFNSNDKFDGKGIGISGYDDNSKSLIKIDKSYALTLKNFKLSNAYLDEASSINSPGVAGNSYKVELKNVLFSNNRSITQGGAIRVCGNLNIDSCSFINNSAIKGGAISLSANLWTANIINSSFISNQADSAAAIFIDKGTNLYARANSFVNNKSNSFGAFTILGDAVNTQFTFVNNTFANNTLRFSKLSIAGIPGGSAIYFKPGSDSKIALLNNTITGNVCIDEQNRSTFKGAAVQLVTGSAFVYNNIIAGNFSSSGIGDIRFEQGSVLNCIGKNNLYTSVDNIIMKYGSTDIMASNYLSGISFLTNTLDGYINSSRFVANITTTDVSTPVVHIINPIFGTSPINKLAKRDLNQAYMLNVDMDGGLYPSFTILDRDQTGYTRNMDGYASIGAFEYHNSTSELLPISQDSRMFYANGTLWISGCSGTYRYAIYNIQGNLIKNGLTDNHKIDLHTLARGCYICFIKGRGNDYKSCKFVR